jgi:tetratricopeptide (TPR) repeat protein
VKQFPRAAVLFFAAALRSPLCAQAPVTLQQAELLWKQGQFMDANDVFRDLVAQNPNNADYRVRWGRLFVEYGQPGDANGLFKEAMQIKPDYPPAILGMAFAAASAFEGNAAELARAALKADPKLVEAQELLARLALEDNNDTRARDEAHKALDIDSKSVQARAILATMDWLADKKESTWDPRDAKGYETAGHFFMINRRYNESIDYYRKAIALDPNLVTARSELGINLMRMGQTAEAFDQLKICFEKGFKGGPTSNSLKLIDSYKNYDTYKTDNTILMVNKKEAELLHPYFESEMKRVIATYEKKYKFKLEHPVQVEVYNDHDDFAVRTTGVPGIGALGVTFGYTIAEDSPSARPPGEFHWAGTLWHEMSHVFTLAMTNSKIPRWFTEGIAVHEENDVNPEWGDRLGVDEINAIKDHKLLPIADLDRGFIHPSYPRQVVVSYYQGGQVVDFITQKWGWDTVLAMVHDYAENTDTPTVIRKELRVAPEEFDKELDAFIDSRTHETVSHFSEWKDGMKKLVDLATKKDNDGVVQQGLAIRDMYKDYVEQGSVYEFLATAYRDKKDMPNAIDELMRYAKNAGRNPATLKLLAKDLVDANRKKDAADILNRLNYIYPLDGDLHRRLGELWLDLGNAAGAAREFTAEIAFKPIDPAQAHYDLARAYNNEHQTDKATEQVVKALEIAPGFRPAQKLLLELSAKQDPKK